MKHKSPQADEKEIHPATSYCCFMHSPIFLSSTIFITALFIAAPAFAHSAERGLIMLLPTEYYIAGGGLAVLLSFLLLAIIPQSGVGAFAHKSRPILPAFSVGKAPVSVLSLLLLAICIVAGFISVHDPMNNPLPLVIWTAWWIALTLAHAIFGNLWLWLNPWTGLLYFVRKMTGNSIGIKPIYALPTWVGYVSSILQFSLFAWFELISLAPEDPPRLASAVLCYWLFNIAAMILFGEAEWMKRGEPFSVFLSMIGMFSPFRILDTDRGKKIALAWPGRKCLGADTLPFSGTIFILLTLGTASFDGFAETFTWLGFIGINPLEFPGRSSVMLQNTFGLASAPIILALLFYTSVAAGSILSVKSGWKELQPLAGRLVYSIVPISIAFHSAHYLTKLLINGQYLIVVISDPFALGWDLFGTVDMHVTASFLQHLESVRIIWVTQTAMIVAGHVAGIVVAHIIACDAFGATKTATTSQLFLSVNMVFYTAFGLWLLSTPTVG